MYNKLTAAIIINGEKLKPFFVRCGQGWPLTTLLFNIALASCHKNKLREFKLEKKSTFFADDIIYTGDPNDFTKKAPWYNRPMQQSSYKVNTQNSVTFLYIKNESEEKVIKESTHLK